MISRLRWPAAAWAVLGAAVLAIAGPPVAPPLLPDEVRRAVRATPNSPSSPGEAAIPPTTSTEPALPPAPYTLVSVLGDPAFRHDREVTQAVALADGKRILTSGNDGTARLWDLATGRQLQCYRHKTDYVWDVLPLPGEEQLLTAGGEEAVILWDLRTGQRLAELPHEKMVFRLALDAGGKRLAAGDRGGQCIVWDLAGRRELERFSAAESSVYTVRFGPDGNSIIAGLSDSTIRSWGLDSNQEKVLKQKDRNVKLAELIGGLGDTGDIFTLVASRDCQRLLVCCSKRPPWLMEASNGREVWRSKDIPFARCGAWSPDGKAVAVLGDKQLSVLEAGSGAKRWSLELSGGTNYGAAWSADSSAVLAGSDHLLCRFDANTGKRTFPPPGEPLRQREAAAVPLAGGDRLLECGGDPGIRLWDRRTRQVKETWLPEERVHELRVSADGQTVVAAAGRFVVALSAADGKEIRRWPAESENGNVILSPDGKWVVIQGQEGLGVWRVADGQKLLHLSREQVGYSSGQPAFGPDLELAVPSGNGPILVFKMPEGEVVQELARPHTQASNDGSDVIRSESWRGVAFVPGDSPALVSWTDKELCLWSLGLGEASALSEAEVGRLVEQLGSTSFQDREAATKRLIAGGRAVLPLLRKVESKDMEQKARLALVQKEVLSGSAMRVVASLDLKEGGNASFAVHPDGRRWVLAHGQPPRREILLGEVRGRELRALGTIAAPHAARWVVFDSQGVLVAGNYNGTVCEYAPTPRGASAPAGAR